MAHTRSEHELAGEPRSPADSLLDRTETLTSGELDGGHSRYVSAGDGAVDRIWRGRPKGAVAAIFVHAGAGYHSTANEKLHLEVCSKAARLAMAFLKAGSSAVDAVEVAIKCLEDTEVTNAGFGSNLSMDGTVECDATIVDHLGRSGACGAVPMIKNPISLARVILDKTSLPLSLRRVPPNILVGTGAKDFANEQGMPIVPNELLVSKNALDRYRRWAEDLKRAERKASESPSPVGQHTPTSPPGSGDELTVAAKYDKDPRGGAGASAERDHINAILTGTWNEGQPDSPRHDSTPSVETGSPSRPQLQQRLPLAQSPISPVNTSGKAPLLPPNRIPTPFAPPPQGSTRTDSPHKRQRLDFTQSRDGVDGTLQPPPNTTLARGYPAPVVSPTHDRDAAMDGEAGSGSGTGVDGAADNITDTVGAIAIDMAGNLAAGSSSGGIGMKHSGRIGPAALVGIGTAVLPTDPSDKDATSVAAVTSGTGEHMATTMASHTCAERLYYNIRRGEGGRHVQEYDEDLLMESFITHDFMNHPGVKNQNSAGAIGVMAVKKTRAGHYFYFAHNTDSFALSAMSSNDKDPLVVMSRLGQNQTIARGGRKIRID